MIEFEVNKDLCVQCGVCAQDCVFGILQMGESEYPELSGDGCIKCQHCLAVCPTGALSILGNSPEDSTPLKDGSLPNAEQMATLIKGRRSVRRYKNEPLEPATIQHLLEVSWHAPTGVNSQQVQITLMDNPEDVKVLSEELYQRLEEGFKNNTLPETPITHYFKWALEAREHGIDMIFRDAPHFIIASSPKSAPSPVADTHIFLSYFELMAQSMKLGTMWNGFLKYTVSTIFPDLGEKLGIPEDHEIGYAMIFGKPAVKYHRTVERGPANVKRVDWKG